MSSDARSRRRTPISATSTGIFRTLRAFSFAMAHEEHVRNHREALKDTVIGDTERGLALGGMDVVHAEVKRAALLDRVVEFFDRFDYLVCPTTQVPPFSIDTEWVREIGGVKLETYIDWMAACYAITVTGCPSISVPAGFTPDGLPIGIQIVAPPKCELRGAPACPCLRGRRRFRGPPPAALMPQAASRASVHSHIRRPNGRCLTPELRLDMAGARERGRWSRGCWRDGILWSSGGVRYRGSMSELFPRQSRLSPCVVGSHAARDGS